MICGLLGRRLGHSYSPQIHKMLGSYDYRFFEREPEALGEFLTSAPFDGINVTIPYKKDVIPYCSALSEDARRIGSVNTIIRTENGLYGDNTDCFGFRWMVKRSGCTVRGKKAIILGSGGASLTAQDVLKSLGAREVRVISRTGADNYENISRSYDADIIVNATPVGMYPNNGERLIQLEAFRNCSCVLDIIYNPSLTGLLLDAERLGIPHENGLSMLVAQAKRAAELFTASTIDDGVIDNITSAMSAAMKSIVIIGMPGCGKSTTAALLAKRLGREFFDCDKEFEKRFGRSAGSWITEFGQASFREKESEVLTSLCSRSACVIATGGGCVTVPENYPVMHQNSTIVWLRRDTSLLPVSGRPLSISSGTERLYLERAPLYARFSDIQVKNDGTKEQAAEKIIRRLGL